MHSPYNQWDKNERHISHMEITSETVMNRALTVLIMNGIYYYGIYAYVGMDNKYSQDGYLLIVFLILRMITMIMAMIDIADMRHYIGCILSDTTWRYIKLSYRNRILRNINYIVYMCSVIAALWITVITVPFGVCRDYHVCTFFRIISVIVLIWSSLTALLVFLYIMTMVCCWNVSFPATSQLPQNVSKSRPQPESQLPQYVSKSRPQPTAQTMPSSSSGVGYMFKQVKEMVLPVATAQVQCVICCDDCSETVTTLSCGHSYHSECIQTWIRRSKTCPLCRSPVVDADIDV